MLPFRQKQTSTAISFHRIDVPGFTTIYLQKLGYITVNEAIAAEVTDNSLLESQLSSQVLTLEAIAEIMEETGLTFEHAKAKLFGEMIQVEGAEVVTEESQNQQLALFRNMGRERYLQLGRALAQQNQDRSLIDRTATILIQGRTLYGIRLTKAARAGKEELTIGPCPFSLEKGTWLNADGQLIQTAKAVAEGDETISLKEPLKSRVGGEVAFLCGEDLTPLVGYSDWSVENTRALPVAPIDAVRKIHEFYLSERMAFTQKEDDSNMSTGKLENSSATSKADEKLPQELIGAASTGSAA
ncbi:hypothetical protein [Adonisia turfae]|uniref:Uncharacterized protein n=1 Tax=Adonisia turfae CCMR0081 TaxID=2292702 RepID=A0A6M0RJ30_9CYAN|nr:hypothetical protein [Adonisia turfae]NEZ56235.1 hypothetical protein [Adonisia turfae CCMR0081]